MARASWDDSVGEDGRLLVLPSHVRAAKKAGTGQRRLGFTAERDNLPSAA